MCAEHKSYVPIKENEHVARNRQYNKVSQAKRIIDLHPIRKSSLSFYIIFKNFSGLKQHVETTISSGKQ